MDNRQREYIFRQDRILVGRDKECDLRFSEEPTVSPRHLMICRTEEGWYIEDLDSAGGTTLNGAKLEPNAHTLLEEDDRIVLAETVTLQFRLSGVDGIVLIAEPKRLSEAEEQALGLLAAQGDQAARTKLFDANLHLVAHIVKRHSGLGRDEQELLQEGYLALMQAIDRFDWTKGQPFSRYAALCIREAIARAAGEIHHREASEYNEDFEFFSTQQYEVLPPSCGGHTAADIPIPPSPKPSGRSRRDTAQEELPRSKDRRRGIAALRKYLQNRRAPQPDSIQPDDIQFRAAAPATLNRGQYFLVKIMAYPEADYERADREQMTLADRVRAATSSIFQANYNDTFRIQIRSEDFPMEEKTLLLTWTGKYASAETDILLPADYVGEQVRLTARVYLGIRVLTDLILILQIQAPRQQEVLFEKQPVRTAFVSYASKDLDRVLPRIQGLLLGQQDMDVFLDRKDLIRGERWEPRLYKEIEERDIFYLFWSNNARNSPWVQKELAHAIETKGLMSIEPVPLEDPMTCPPPEQLQDRHFNDWTLRFMTRQ